MKPLEVTATLRGSVALPNGPMALDGIIAYAVAMEMGLVGAHLQDEIVPIEIPVKRHQRGTFHLASVGHCEVESSERRWLNRRFPTAEAQSLGEPKLKSYRIDSGACRSYRLPLATFHARDDLMTWWCVGDTAEVRRLLQLISYVGKKRSTGCGRVMRWDVRELDDAELWAGFPILRDGMPLRALPIDLDGLSDEAQRSHGTLTYPYWARWLEQPIAVPSEAIRMAVGA